jgi:hypothetical protein
VDKGTFPYCKGEVIQVNTKYLMEKGDNGRLGQASLDNIRERVRVAV